MKKLILGFLCSCLLCACATTPAHRGLASVDGAVKSETSPLVGAFKAQRFVLSNGFKVLVVEDHSSPTFAYQTWFNVGSRDEVVPRTGLAHLFEHLMFKETSNHPEGEYDHLLEESGVEDENAFTSWDYTAFVQELPKDKLDLIASLESDRMVNLVVNEHAFTTEREVVQNERRYRNENSPEGRMYQELFEEAFRKHSYHWPVIGYEKDLAGMTAKNASDFYRAHYSPNHATLIVVGDVSPDDVLKTAQKYYGAIPAQDVPEHAIPAEPAQTSPRKRAIPLSIQVEKLLLGYHVPGVMSDDVPALSVLDAVLTAGKSSRLHRALVDRGIAGSVDTEMMQQKDPSLFIFECDLQKSKRATQAEKIIRQELARLGRDGVGEDELKKAKNLSLFSFYQGMEGDGGKANFIGRYESMTGNYDRGLQIRAQMRKVTSEQLQEMIRKYFQPKNESAVIGTIKKG